MHSDWMGNFTPAPFHWDLDPYEGRGVQAQLRVNDEEEAARLSVHIQLGVGTAGLVWDIPFWYVLKNIHDPSKDPLFRKLVIVMRDELTRTY